MRRYLLTPGPVEIPESVAAAAAKPIIGHRCAEFSALFMSIEDKLKSLLNVNSPVIILPSSGTGALEALAVNFLDNGDKFLSVSCGVFGNRFREIAQRLGATPVCLDIPMGESATPDYVADFVAQHPECGTLFLTHNETSTGVVNPIKEIISKIPKDKRPLILLDCVSSAGGMELYPEEWGVDAVAFASQKGLLTPPGLGFAWLSEKAWKYLADRQCRSYYFDLKLHLKEIQGKAPANPYTPPVSLYFALDEALNIILKDGKEAWFKTRIKYSKAIAAGLEAMGYTLLVREEDRRSPGVTAFYSKDMDSEMIRKKLSSLGIDTAGGQGELKGKLIRAAHYNDFGWTDICLFLSSLYTISGRDNCEFLNAALQIWNGEE